MSYCHNINRYAIVDQDAGAKVIVFVEEQKTRSSGPSSSSLSTRDRSLVDVREVSTERTSSHKSNRIWR